MRISIWFGLMVVEPCLHVSSWSPVGVRWRCFILVVGPSAAICLVVGAKAVQPRCRRRSIAVAANWGGSEAMIFGGIALSCIRSV